MTALYQDPVQPSPPALMATAIGHRLVPDDVSLGDPVMLRHVLSLMICVHNSFHTYLCWRQFRLCRRSTAPPSQMLNVMSQDMFDATRSTEMHDIELKLINYVLDAIFSCTELYLGVYAHLWKMIMMWYQDIGDKISRNLAFVLVFTAYMVLRTLPSVLYDKLILDPFYNVDPELVPPLVGLLCARAFIVVLAQVILIPVTAIFLTIEIYGGRFFLLWIWMFLFALSIALFVSVCLCGAPCLGKTIKLPDTSLRNALRDVLAVFKFPIDRVYIIRTQVFAKSTAYVVGCCSCKRIIILDRLLWNFNKPVDELFDSEIGKGLKDDQVAGYLAHELSHWRFSHTTKTFCMLHLTLLTYLVIFGTCYHVKELYESAGFARDFFPDILGYWLVYKYVMPPYLTITNWLIFHIIRRFEYTADRQACKLGYCRLLSSALLKLFADDPVFPYIDKWYFRWHHLMPTCLQRLEELHDLELDLGNLPSL